jgi:hypothetical protein
LIDLSEDEELLIKPLLQKTEVVLFEYLFSLKKLQNMTVVRHFEVVLGQTLNYFV